MAHATKNGGNSHGSSHGSSHASHGASHSGGGHGGDSHGAAHGGGGGSHGSAHGGDSHGAAAHGGGGGSHGGGGNSNIFLWILAFIAFCFICDSTCTGFKKMVNGESNSTTTTYTQDVSTKYPLLKKGEAPQRIIIPSGYKCNCTGGGKKYYHQDQNGPREIWGDGTFHQGSEHAAYIDLSYYNEQITVVCEFIKL